MITESAPVRACRSGHLAIDLDFIRGNPENTLASVSTILF